MATFLAPAVASPPLYDDPLEDAFQATIVGITGIAGDLVRPRWQPEPPNQPPFTTNWVAFGIMTMDGDRYAWQGHDPTLNGGTGGNKFEKDERLNVLHSFYGPGSQQMAARYKDGLQIGLNREALLAFDIKLTECLETVNVPALMKNKWVKRVDMRALFVRRIKREYAVPSLLTATVGLNNDIYVENINVSINP
jgi:hypothetical protein